MSLLPVSIPLRCTWALRAGKTPTNAEHQPKPSGHRGRVCAREGQSLPPVAEFVGSGEQDDSDIQQGYQ